MNEVNLRSLFDKYNEAFVDIKERFNLMNKEFSELGDDNPIEFIKYRIKKPDSIAKKLKKKSLPLTAENIEKSLNDIIGVRIVCSFLDDLEIIKEKIKNMEANGEFTIIKVKDYVNNPKENGYSSYHIIVSKLIKDDDKEINIKYEIQIRTIAMDMAASLEHKLNYKKEKMNSNSVSDLRETFEFCNRLDDDMNTLVRESNNSVDSSKFDIPEFMSRKEYIMMKFKYKVALDIMEKKLNKLKEKYEKNGLVNPIEHIKGRIKDDEAIVRKLMLSGRDVSLDNVLQFVNDMAGIRIVCSFLSDLDGLKEIIKSDPELIIVKEKDYVTNPKESGYRGYHLIVGVPMYLSNGFTLVKVEIQIRTIAMEMWASLEQKICYHKNADEKTRNELKRLASVIADIDDEMENIVAHSKQNSNVKKLVKKKNDD